MKKIDTTVILFLFSFSLFAQNIEGKWQGLLKVQGTELTIVFNISQQNDSLVATMDSPDQGAFGLDVQEVSFENDQLILGMNMPPIQYEGILKSDGEINGVFKQGGEAVQKGQLFLCRYFQISTSSFTYFFLIMNF